MKVGKMVWIPAINRYGYIHEIAETGKVKTVEVLNHDTGKFDVIDVLDKIVEAVSLIKELLLLIMSVFNKKAI